MTSVTDPLLVASELPWRPEPLHPVERLTGDIECAFMCSEMHRDVFRRGSLRTAALLCT